MSVALSVAVVIPSDDWHIYVPESEALRSLIISNPRAASWIVREYGNSSPSLLQLTRIGELEYWLLAEHSNCTLSP